MSLKSFDPDIQTKLFDRIEVAGRKNPPPGEPVSDSRSEVIASLYAKTTWLRMSSLLLNAPILMGGELQSSEGEVNVLKEGFSDIYPEFGRGGVLDQPFRPMPGVKSASIDFRGYFLREGKIEWVCWSLEELERLKPYYLSIQKPVLLEWGWSYPNQFYDEGLVDLSSNSEELEGLAGKLPERIKKNGGDYDAMLGKISNFEWSVRPDGGFDCSTRLISQASNVMTNMFPSSTSSTRYQLTEGGELDEESKTEVNFKAYIKNLKFQLTQIPEIKSVTSESAGVGSLDSGTELDKKYKVFYSNEKVSDDEKKKDALDIGPYVTWGWMEDNIISRFVSKIETSEEGGTNITGWFRSRQGESGQQKSNIITNHKELYTVDPNRFILPGQYPVNLIDPTDTEETTQNAVKVAASAARKEKIRKVYNNINKGFAPFTVNDDKKSGYLRNIVIHYKLIQKAFEDSNTVEDGINYLTEELARDFGQLWDFKIAGNPMNSEEIGVIDQFAPGKDITNTDGNYSTPENTDKLFMFPVQNKDSIVKSQTMRSTVPSSMQMAVAMSANPGGGFAGFSTEGTVESLKADVWGGLQQETSQEGDTSSVTLENPSIGAAFGRKDANEQKELEIETANGVDVFGVGEDDPFTKSVDALTKAQKEEVAKIEQQKETKEIVEANKWPSKEETVGKIYHSSGVMKPGYQQLMRARLYKEVTGIDVAVLVPITLDVEIDGISGVQLFQHFHVDYIPEQYKTGAAFRVMSISQQIDSNTWSTTIKGQMVVSRTRSQ